MEVLSLADLVEHEGRNRAILLAVRAGWKRDALVDFFAISRERIYQILRDERLREQWQSVNEESLRLARERVVYEWQAPVIAAAIYGQLRLRRYQ